MLIGESSGRSRSALERRPRRYYVPHNAIRFGQVNRLRIEIKGRGGSQKISEIGEPLTVAPLAPLEPLKRLEASKARIDELLRKVYRLERWDAKSILLLDFFAYWRNLRVEIEQLDRLIENEDWNLLEESFQEVNASEKAMKRLADKIENQIKKIEGSKYQIDMLSIAAREGVFAKDFKMLKDRNWMPPYRRSEGFSRWGWFLEDGLPAVSQVTPTFILGPDGQKLSFRVNRILDVSVVDLNWVSKTYLVRAELELNGQTEMATFEVLTSVFYPGFLIFPKFNAYSSVLRPETLMKFFDMQDRQGTPVRYFVPLPAIPQNELGKVILGWNGAEKEVPFLLRITSHQRDPMSMHIAACFPSGIRRVDTRGWKDREYTPKNMKNFPYIEYLSRNFPWDLREYYRYDEAKREIVVYDVFEYYYPPGKTKMVIVPPLLSKAIRNGYPAKIQGEVFDLGIDTFYGPLQGVYTQNGILEYTLPVPSMDEWVRPSIPESANPWQDLLGRSLSYLSREEDSGRSSIDNPYLAPAFSSLPLFNEDILQEIQSYSSRQVKARFMDDQWLYTLEPFSRLPVYWTTDRIGPYLDYYDQELGCSLSLYEVYQYGQCLGDFNYWRSIRPLIDKIWKWSISTDDWAWMRCANARHGYGTGDGSYTLAAFSGALAYSKIMHQIDKKAQGDEGAYLLARTAVSLVSRFYDPEWEKEQGWVQDRQAILGFREGQEPVVVDYQDDPDLVNSMISCQGIQPEAMHFLLEYVPDELKQYLDHFEEAHPDWNEGKLSGKITFPQLYVRTLLGAPQDTLEKSFQNASKNPDSWWMAPPALAEWIFGESGVYLKHWGESQIRKTWLENSRLHIEIVNRRNPLDLRLSLERPPKSVEMNGNIVKNWIYDAESKEFRIRLLILGYVQIIIDLEPEAAKGDQEP